MADTIFDTQPGRGRIEIRTGVGRRRRWTKEEKGRIVAEAIAPGAVIAEIARRHDLAPQHLSNWIRAAKHGRLALPGDGAFVPVVADAFSPSVVLSAIEIAIGPVVVRVPHGADRRTLEAVLGAVRRSFA